MGVAETETGVQRSLSEILVEGCVANYASSEDHKRQRKSLINNIRTLGLRLQGADNEPLPELLTSKWGLKDVRDFNGALSGTYSFPEKEVITMVSIAKALGLEFSVSKNAYQIVLQNGG